MVFQRVAWLCAFGLALTAAVRLPRIEEDTTCATHESQWYLAEDHLHQLQTWAFQVGSGVTQKFHTLDLFGASGRIADAFERRGYRGTVFDIKEDKRHDVTSESGMKLLFLTALQLFDGGLIAAGPPCSLFVSSCQSVHKRTASRPEGDLRVFKVRLAQRIWANMAVFLAIIMIVRPTLRLMLEQPSGSWGFKQPFMEELARRLKLKKVKTWMCYFRHDMLKCTHLKGNFRSLGALEQTLTTSDRLFFQARFQRRQAKRKVKKVYHYRTVRADGKTTWNGGRDLASSAEYTRAFANAVVQAWQKAPAVDMKRSPMKGKARKGRN